MLLLDAGNSAIKAQWWHDKALQYTFSARYVPGWQSRLVAFLADIKASHCYYSSVLIDALESDLLVSLRQFLPAANIHRITPLESCHGVRNAYQPSEGIGVDRWIAKRASRNAVFVVLRHTRGGFGRHQEVDPFCAFCIVFILAQI